MYCELREGLALSGASTAVPTPASSECSSRGPLAGSLPNHLVAKSRPNRTVQNFHEVDLEMASDAPVGKAVSPLRNRTSRTTGARGSSPTRSRTSEETLKNGGQTATRSRAEAKGRASRSTQQSPSISPVRSPLRSNSPSAPQGSRQRSISNARLQSSQLERQLKESEAARADLEKQLQEERDASAADRAKLTRFAERLSNLENNRELSTRLLEDNRLLREELEAQEAKVQDLTNEIEKLRGAAPPPTFVLSSPQGKLLEENARLRHDLQESQIMLAKYTRELNQIMPGVELILTQYQKDNPEGSLPETMLAQLQTCPEMQIEQRAGLLSTSHSVHELPPAPYPIASSSQQTEPRMAQAVSAPEPQERCSSSVAAWQSVGGKGRGPNSRARSSGKNGSRHSSLSPQPSYARAPPPALKGRQGARGR